jgi:hypothetical protein
MKPNFRIPLLVIALIFLICYGILWLNGTCTNLMCEPDKATDTQIEAATSSTLPTINTADIN